MEKPASKTLFKFFKVRSGEALWKSIISAAGEAKKDRKHYFNVQEGSRGLDQA